MHLQVFFIQPNQLLVYSLTNADGESLIYNAGSLELIDDDITGFVEIDGYVTDKFGINPTVLVYNDGRFQIVYAPDKLGYIFTSDGSPVKHNGSQVVAHSNIKIPDTINGNNPMSIPLTDPNKDSLERFITLSQCNKEQDTSLSYDTLIHKEKNKKSMKKVVLPSSIKKDIQGSEQTVSEVKMPVVSVIDKEIVIPLGSVSSVSSVSSLENVAVPMSVGNTMNKITLPDMVDPDQTTFGQPIIQSDRLTLSSPLNSKQVPTKVSVMPKPIPIVNSSIHPSQSINKKEKSQSQIVSLVTIPNDFNNITESIGSPMQSVKSPSPRINQNLPYWSSPSYDREMVQSTSEVKNEIKEIQKEIKDLKNIIKAINQRLYRIYPVEIPADIVVDNDKAAVIPYEEIIKKHTNNEIDTMVMDPLLQPYAGSHRSNNRMITVSCKDGKKYISRVDYDAKNGKFNAPK